MKQPKKLIRRIKEHIGKHRPDLDIDNYMLAEETSSHYVIQEKGTKNLITISK